MQEESALHPSKAVRPRLIREARGIVFDRMLVANDGIEKAVRKAMRKRT